MADMSIKYMGMTFWRSNADWYYIDEKCNRYVLTDKAPEEAKRNFEYWKKINNIKWGEKEQ